MFIAALFTIARTWKQPKCPSTDEWIKKMWHVYTMEYYSAIKRNEIGLYAVRWIDLVSVIQSEVCMLTHKHGIQKKIISEEPKGRTGIKMQTLENGLEDTRRGNGKLGRSERVTWTYIHYQM